MERVAGQDAVRLEDPGERNAREGDDRVPDPLAELMKAKATRLGRRHPTNGQAPRDRRSSTSAHPVV
jgi:hypothetical protein